MTLLRRRAEGVEDSPGDAPAPLLAVQARQGRRDAADRAIGGLRASGATGEVAAAIGLVEAWGNTAAAETRGGSVFELWARRYDELDGGYALEWTPDDPTSTPRGLDDPALACFEISDVLPLDLKRVRALLRERNIGRLEIKKRGVDHDPHKLRRQLGLIGEESATLFVTRLRGRVTAILARRIN